MDNNYDFNRAAAAALFGRPGESDDKGFDRMLNSQDDWYSPSIEEVWKSTTLPSPLKGFFWDW